MNRLDHIREFYDLLDRLAVITGGARPLGDTVRSAIPARGVYFFFEAGEHRTDSGSGDRVVRVGTHALRPNSGTTLKGRLRQHLGSRSGGGHHRTSIFRLLIGDALLSSNALPACASWGLKNQARDAARNLGMSDTDLKLQELPVEREVSRRLSAMSVLTLLIDDEPGPHSRRGWIERNAIAMLSNENKPPIDPPSANWLGLCSQRVHVRHSGLWNRNHVDEPYDAEFLVDLRQLLQRRG